MLHTLAFLVLAGLTAIFGLGTLFLPNMIHAFLSFIGCLLSVAGVFFSLQADYLGAVQIIVYAGSVAVLIVLALLMINRRQGDMSHTNKWAHKWVGGALASLLVGGALGSTILYTHFTGWPLMGTTADIQPVVYADLADKLLNEHMVAFELMAVLLLAALVAAVAVARGHQAGNGKE
ncbi:MAG: NADH-quinone oxidoreductase subunit J [Firmicutes bacterium]|nr:NADH-quinone oxidoreductase subunit J [Bacillota bacterium]